MAHYVGTDSLCRFRFATSTPIVGWPSKLADSGWNTARSSTGNAPATTSSPARSRRFRRACKLKEGEIVVFSWIVYKSRDAPRQRQRQGDEGSALQDMMDPKSMPFDGKRMFWGGFKTLVEMPSGAV